MKFFVLIEYIFSAKDTTDAWEEWEKINEATRMKNVKLKRGQRWIQPWAIRKTEEKSNS